MPSSARVAPGGQVYHVLNRSVGRMDMFRKEDAPTAAMSGYVERSNSLGWSTPSARRDGRVE
jgi:hypothetical protein